MLTPRPYLSWTQLNLWESSPERYKQTYFYGKRIPINRGMAFGKTMATGLENDEASGDPLLDLLMAQLPKFECMEHEVRANLNLGRGVEPIPLLAKLDSARSNLTGFKEYKTGQKPWSKKLVDESGQITFYQTIIYCATGKLANDIELVHVETETDEAGRVVATGKIYPHRTTRNMADVLKMFMRIKKAWAGITAMAEQELL
jgi:hypothetical protein